MYYYLMRKNDVVTTVELNDMGQLVWADYQNVKEPEKLPLELATSTNRLSMWWEHRSVPIKQGKIAEMLREKGFQCSEEYLTKNLGLSLTDYYWVKPIDSELEWKDVNLFENDFHNEMVVDTAVDDSKIYGKYTPNSSLQGALEKKWGIIDGERYLIKGNRDNFSTESINEVIASKIHELQGFGNYTPYALFEIKKRDYDYGCISKLFTSQKEELISAYAVVTSEKQPNDKSSYEQFISLCKRHGIDGDQLRMEMEYQMPVDFIISGRDRHLNNIAILRDADTLQFKRMAPIFDSGKSMFIRQDIPDNNKALLSLRTESFAATELQLMKYVQNRKLVDISKLPGRDVISDLYHCDSQMSDRRISDICDAYERKIELYRNFQLGKSLNQIKFASVQQKQGTGKAPIFERKEEA